MSSNWAGETCRVLLLAAICLGPTVAQPASGQEPKEREPLHDTRWVKCVAFSPDGKTLASGSTDVKLWDVASGKEKATLKGPTRGVNCLAFSPDGKTLA